MSKTCKVYKSCCICGREKHNLQYDSNKKGRTSLKPYCKSCKAVYFGVKQNLIELSDYIGKNFDVSQLHGDEEGNVIRLHKNFTYSVLPLELSKRLVQQGGAYITSSNTIVSMIEGTVKSRHIEPSVRQKVLERDKGVCRYCGDKGETMDHIIPRDKGGLNTLLNLTCACMPCNTLKDNMSKETFLRKRKLGIISDERLQKIKNKIARKKEKEAVQTKQQKKESKSKTHKQKRCSICQVLKPVTKFAQGGHHCRKCDKLKGAYDRGWITAVKIARISTDSTELKGVETTIEYSDGTTEIIPKKLAKEYAKAGIVEVVSKSYIKVLFSEDKIEEIAPGVLLKCVETDDTEKIKGENIAVYAEDTYLGTTKKRIAIALIKQNKASVLKKNRIMVCKENEKEIISYITDRYQEFIKIKSPSGVEVGKVLIDKKEELEKLSSLGVAYFKDKNEFHLKEEPQKIVFSYPMLKLKQLFYKGIIKKIPSIKRFA